MRSSLCSGADVNIQDNDGDIPLHLALGGRRQTGGNDPVCRRFILTNILKQFEKMQCILSFKIVLIKNEDYLINPARGQEREK